MVVVVVVVTTQNERLQAELLAQREAKAIAEQQIERAQQVPAAPGAWLALVARLPTGRARRLSSTCSACRY